MTSEFVNIPEALNTQLEQYALQFLRQGRVEWDEPHTRAVVYYAGLIARNEGLDPLVQTTTAWLHDIGYFGLFKGNESKQYDEVKDRKEAHMIVGAKMANEFLERPEIKIFYTPEQRKRVVHLVSVHDKMEDLKDLDEIAFMEADTLGAIDINRVATSYDKESAFKYINEGLTVRRYPRFRTATGKKLFGELIGPFVDQFKD